MRWPTGDELRAKEPAYFGARDERNSAARRSWPSTASFDRVPSIEPSLVERAAAAVAKLREAREELMQLLDYGQPLHVMRYPIEKLTGKE